MALSLDSANLVSIIRAELWLRGNTFHSVFRCFCFSPRLMEMLITNSDSHSKGEVLPGDPLAQNM